MVRALDPNEPAGEDCMVGKLKPLTPQQARADIRAALEEAIDQGQREADREGSTPHGRYLEAMVRRWRDVLTRSLAAGA